MMRLKSFSRLAASLAFLIVLLLSGFARPAWSQSDESDAKTKAPRLLISPKKLNFGNQVFSTTSPSITASPSKQVTVTNSSGTQAVSITSIVVSSPFVRVGGDCGTSISAGASCTVEVAFNPTSTRKVKNKKGLSFTDSAQKSPQHVALQGKGITGPTPTPTATPTATATHTATSTPTATATSTATATATATPTVTATSTSGATATATVTATATSTGIGGATPTATATATVGGSATPTPTPTVGPQAGDVLIAGGDTGGLLASIIEFSMDTVSTNAAEIYEAVSDTFTTVGNLTTAREGTATVVLPNGKTLIVGGQHCFTTTIPAGGACTSTFTGFQCDALNTAELYTETGASTGTFARMRSGRTSVAEHRRDL